MGFCGVLTAVNWSLYGSPISLERLCPVFHHDRYVPFHFTFPVVGDVCTITREPKFVGQGSLAPCASLLTRTVLLTLRKWAIIMPVDMRPLYSGADRWLAIFSTRGFRLIQTRFTWFVWSKHNNDVRGLALWTFYITWGLKLTTELTGFSAFMMHPFFRTFLPTGWFTCFACGR